MRDEIRRTIITLCCYLFTGATAESPATLAESVLSGAEAFIVAVSEGCKAIDVSEVTSEVVIVSLFDVEFVLSFEQLIIVIPKIRAIPKKFFI